MEWKGDEVIEEWENLVEGDAFDNQKGKGKGKSTENNEGKERKTRGKGGDVKKNQMKKPASNQTKKPASANSVKQKK